MGEIIDAHLGILRILLMLKVKKSVIICGYDGP